MNKRETIALAEKVYGKTDKRVKEINNIFNEAENKMIGDISNFIADEVNWDSQAPYELRYKLMKSIKAMIKGTSKEEQLFIQQTFNKERIKTYRDVIKAKMKQNLVIAGETENNTISNHIKNIAEYTNNELQLSNRKSNKKPYKPVYKKQAIERALHSKWAGKPYTIRIFLNKQDAMIKLDKFVDKIIDNGYKPATFSKELKNILGNSRYKSERILRTETTAALTNGMLDDFKSRHVKHYKILNSGSNVCPVCKGFDDEVFLVSEAEIGVNMPPFHPNCNCIAIEAVNESFKKNDFLDDFLSNNNPAGNKAKILLKEAIKYDNKVTDDMKKYTKESGFSLIGLDHRLKSEESLSRKIKSETTGKKMRDVLRYTGIAEPDALVENYQKFIQLLEENGYNEVVMKNYWLRDGAYKGINTFIETPDGYEFEMQYHTQESFDLKDVKMHEIYEEQRKLDPIKDADKYKKLEDEMKRLSDSLKIPKNISNIKDGG